MNEYETARCWKGARVTRGFAGTDRIMRDVTGRSRSQS